MPPLFFWIKTDGRVEEISEEKSEQIGKRTFSKRTIAIVRLVKNKRVVVVHQESWYEHDSVKLTLDQVRAIAGLIE